jgi:hypothetical protein
LEPSDLNPGAEVASARAAAARYDGAARHQQWRCRDRAYRETDDLILDETRAVIWGVKSLPRN